MAGELKDRGPRDHSPINVTGDGEVRWWCKELGCTTTQLVNAIKSVGPTADKVRAYLKKPEAGNPEQRRHPLTTCAAALLRPGQAHRGAVLSRNGTL